MGYYYAALVAKEGYLEHHGIKGQKWGVRRFQNYDGTLIKGSKNSGASNSSKSKNTTTKKKHVHEFKDYSESVDTRKDVVSATLAAWGGAALSGAATAGSVALGQPYLAAALGIYATVPLAGLAIGGTASIIVGDIDARKANKKEKEFAEEREKNPIDKKTGFHKKTEEMTPEQDMERVNPGYKNWDENTKSNCVLCSMSYELRRRGYDVQANKATHGYDQETLVGDWFKGAKTKTSEGSMTDAEILSLYTLGVAPYITPKRQKEMIRSTVDEVSKQGDGARGSICVIWDGTISAHSISYANENGKLVIYDTQANKRYEGSKAEDYLKQCSYVDVVRLDNCELNTKYIKEVAS